MHLRPFDAAMQIPFLAAWDDDYPAVRVPEIDREHLVLAKELRNLVAAVKDDDGPRAANLAASLIEGAGQHFAHEERLMREIGFAGYERHKHTHDEFLTEARLHLADLRAHGLTGCCLRWVASTMAWFRFHVRTEDTALARAINDAASSIRR
jgi:hemerythrin-like metal-binding protein